MEKPGFHEFTEFRRDLRNLPVALRFERVTATTGCDKLFGAHGGNLAGIKEVGLAALSVEFVAVCPELPDFGERFVGTDGIEGRRVA